MNRVFNYGIKLYLKARYNRIKRMRTQAPQIQKSTLESLLVRAKDTQYAKMHNFNWVDSPEEYSKNVPLTEYNDLRPYIYEMLDGAPDVLWRGRVKWFSKSSGTTSDRSKYIPLSEDALYKNNVASSWDSMAINYHNDPDSKIFWKKSLIMGGSLEPWPSNPNVHVGDVSAILLKRMPSIGRPFYTPDFKTALLPDWEEKIEIMSKKCVNQDVVMFGGVPTWTIVLFNKIMEEQGVDNMLEIWPNAKYYMHGGVGFDPYIDQFKEMFPDPDFQYYEVYNASEGFFAVQDTKDDNGMLLMMDNDIYYEFISMEELTSENPQITPLEEVQVNRNYAIVITTSSGLWRYMPGDTVMFTSTNPYRIKVSGRTKHFINVFGEEVMVGDTEKALAETIKSLPAMVKDYTVAPKFMSGSEKGGHLWLIEFDKLPDNIDAFAMLLDDNLKKINSDYAAKRHKNMALNKLVIQPVPKGTFHKWLASKGKMGGQNKVPRLYNSRKYVDELLQFTGEPV